MARQVADLTWATQLRERPACIPQSRPRGFKALGRRYEALVAKALPAAKHGLWWQFRDANGHGYCQTDFILVGLQWVAILECKHTWSEEGIDQLQKLYMPVVSLALGRPTIGVQICKNLVPWAGPSHQSLFEALQAAKLGNPTTLHWRGLTSLLPTPRKLEISYGRQAAA